jgi:hypothetical protein
LNLRTAKIRPDRPDNSSKPFSIDFTSLFRPRVGRPFNSRLFRPPVGQISDLFMQFVLLSSPQAEILDISRLFPQILTFSFCNRPHIGHDFGMRPAVSTNHRPGPGQRGNMTKCRSAKKNDFARSASANGRPKCHFRPFHRPMAGHLGYDNNPAQNPTWHGIAGCTRPRRMKRFAKYIHGPDCAQRANVARRGMKRNIKRRTKGISHDGVDSRFQNS